jgi:F-type H+-transporting ATPase subunit b
MPQLQPGDFAPQLVWLAITFTLLYFLLSRAVLPRIEHVIGQRKSLIDGDLLKAREAQRQSEAEMARYEAQIASAKAKAQTSVRAAQEKLDAELATNRSALEKEAAAMIKQAEEKIHGLLERAASEMETITSDVVNDIVKELAGVDVTEAEVRAALRHEAKE